MARATTRRRTKFLQTIDRNAERLRLLIEDLLTISELESGRVRLTLEPVGAGARRREGAGGFQKPAGAKEVSLINQVSDFAVRADTDRLEQVLGNLVDNAIKYGRPQGLVTVGGGAREGGQVEVFVRDDGPGIPPEALGNASSSVSTAWTKLARVSRGAPALGWPS